MQPVTTDDIVDPIPTAQEPVSLQETPKESTLEELPTEVISVSQVSPVSPTILAPSLPDFAQGEARLFLDICSGQHAH